MFGQNDNIRIGIFGLWRGGAYIKSLLLIPNVTVTAVCERMTDRIDKNLEKFADQNKKPEVFTDSEAFFASGLFDAVILANYLPEHAKYAIKALRLGIHVLCETTAAATMADAVELCREAEKARERGVLYMMAENYPYSCSCTELRKLYRTGKFGKMMFAEGEYVHPMDPENSSFYNSPTIQGKYHWRRYLPVTYYCSHSLAPIMYATGERPTRVMAMTAKDTTEHISEFKRLRADLVGVMLLSTDGGAVLRINGSTYCPPEDNWYRISCTRGSVETVRGEQTKVRVAYNKWDTPEGEEQEYFYTPEWTEDKEAADSTRHGGGDYFVVRAFIDALRGNAEPFPDVYDSCCMAAVGILGWKSALDGVPYDIPDFRSESDRKKWENDRDNPFPDFETGEHSLPYSTIPVDAGEDW